MGPLLLSRLLELNDTQEGVMNIVFHVADEKACCCSTSTTCRRRSPTWARTARR
jgi:hypothetical protein